MSGLETEPSSTASKLERSASTIKWAVTAIAFVLLLLIAYKSYTWLTGYVDQRSQTQTAVLAEATVASAAARVTSTMPTPAIGRTTRAPQSMQPVVVGEPRAPAVVGDGSIRKCIAGSQITYTSQSCPDGSAEAAAEGQTQTVSMAQAATASPGDHAQSEQNSMCNYLAAEIARLSYEFKQPLPPLVLDQIASDLRVMNDARDKRQCAPASSDEPAAATKAIKRVRKKKPAPIETE